MRKKAAEAYLQHRNIKTREDADMGEIKYDEDIEINLEFKIIDENKIDK